MSQIKKDRNDLKTQIIDAGGKNSAYDANVQFLHGTTIRHEPGKKTLFDGKPTYDFHSAKSKVKK
jgi:hypothetical protein